MGYAPPARTTGEVLPMLTEEAVTHATKDSRPASSLRIVVIDDHPDAADMLQALVQRSGHQARAAYDGKSGLKLVDELSPDVVFVDIGMPNINGYEVARTLRRFPGHQSLRLVAVTGWGQLQDKQRAIDAGFDEHLTKPITPEDIERVLSDLA
jgi:CheY-like chemotaxis protein